MTLSSAINVGAGLAMLINPGARLGVSAPVDLFARPNFATNGGTYSNYPTAVGTGALYNSATGKTSHVWESWDMRATARRPRIVEYDHATGAFSDEYVVGTTVLTNDDHGNPDHCRMASGRKAVFYGSHNTALQWSISTNVNDISAWTPQTAITSPGLDYPHADLVGSDIHLFGQDSGAASYQYYLRKITFDGSDVPTVAAGVLVASFETTFGRIYLGNHIVRGTLIDMCWSQADGADTWRRNVYVATYDTVNHTMNTYGGSRTDALPLSEALMNSTYKVFSHTLPNFGNIPAMAYDASGKLVITFSDGVDGKSAYYIRDTGSGFSAPALISTLADRYVAARPVAYADGRIRFYYARDAQGLGWARGGDSCYKELSAAGVLGPEVVLLAATGPAATGLSLIEPVIVRDAHPDFRIVLLETTVATSLDSAAQQARLWGHGDSGFVKWNRLRGDTLAAAYIARMSVAPSQAIQDAIAVFIQNGLISRGYWDFLSYFGIRILTSQQAALLNIKSASFTAALLSSATWTSKVGVQGTGLTNSGLDTTFNPTSSDTTNFKNLCAAMGCFSATPGQDAGIDMGAGNTLFQTRTASNNFSLRMNTASAANSIANTDGSGFFIETVRGLNDGRAFRNDVQIGTGTSAGSGVIDNTTIRVGNRSSANNPTTRVYEADFVGGSITLHQVKALYDAWLVVSAVIKA